MPKRIKMPKLSDTMEEGVVLAWRKSVGDKVSRGDVLAEIETDKADMEFESYAEGTIAQLLVEPGATIAVGTLIAVIQLPGESDADAAVEVEAQPQPQPGPAGHAASPAAAGARRPVTRSARPSVPRRAIRRAGRSPRSAYPRRP